eukprot:1107006-Karenia_brevis.AAC.1
MVNDDLINGKQKEGERRKLSQWIKAIKMGETVPGSKEANQMLKDIHEKCTRKQVTAVKLGLDWIPRILSDGQQ